jgi:hypothetical protein
MSHTARRSDIFTGAAQPTITVDFGVARYAGVRCYPAHVRQIGAGSLAGGGRGGGTGAAASIPTATNHMSTSAERNSTARAHLLHQRLTMTSTGKIQKFTLREREWAGHTSRIKG